MTLALVGASLAPSAASAWAPAASATVHPGVQVFTAGAQCTSNFVYSDGIDVYLGQAAHCSGTGAATDTNGCNSGSLPIGTPVTITGASRPGTMVYNSWLTMQARGETNPDACDFNDLALIKIDPADVARVNPSVPGFGGPNGVGGASNTGDHVFSYGNSELRFGVTLLSPKQGVVVQTQGNGWSRDVYTVTPGIPGDSGSGFINASGQAIGILSTVQLAPLAASNGVGDLGRELAYMHANTSFGASPPGGHPVTLVDGTEPFAGSLTGVLGVHTQLAGAQRVGVAQRKAVSPRCRAVRRAARRHKRSVPRRCR